MNASEAQPESIRVVYCDAAVQGVEEFGPSEPICLSPKGSGTGQGLSTSWCDRHGFATVISIKTHH